MVFFFLYIFIPFVFQFKMPGTFNRLRDAEAALTPNEQVWAIDVLRSRDSRSYVGMVTLDVINIRYSNKIHDR